MLAPRKRLWSTPDAVLERVMRWDEVSPLTSADQVCDIGCGDGKTLLRWATHVSSSYYYDNRGGQETVPLFPSFVGIDTEESRIKEARAALEERIRNGEIHPSVSVTFHCGNALENDHLWKDATIIFLYLIPRGLRIIKPLLAVGTPAPTRETESLSSSSQSAVQPAAATVVRVISYMSPLPVEEEPLRVEHVPVPHQPGAAWPVYLYQLQRQIAAT